MQSDIIGAIRSDSKYKVVINQQGFGDLMQRLIAILRPMIIKELQIIKSSLRAPVPPPPQPRPSGGSDLLSIFGVNGKNTVKVDTPTHNYGYEVDGELSSSYQQQSGYDASSEIDVSLGVRRGEYWFLISEFLMNIWAWNTTFKAIFLLLTLHYVNNYLSI